MLQQAEREAVLHHAKLKLARLMPAGILERTDAETHTMAVMAMGALAASGRRIFDQHDPVWLAANGPDGATKAN